MFFRKKEKKWKTFLRRLSIAIAVVMIWRGTWDLLDAYLFPENPLLSDLLSIAIGLLILYLPDKNIKELVE